VTIPIVLAEGGLKRARGKDLHTTRKRVQKGRDALQVTVKERVLPCTLEGRSVMGKSAAERRSGN